MANTAIVSEELDLRVSPERLAWGVLLLAFAVFCLICVGSALALHHYAFRSSQPLDMLLRVGSGTVGVKFPNTVEQAATSQRELTGDTIIRTTTTDRWSQAALSFRDDRVEDGLVASVTLKSATTLRVRSASRPRFDWSTSVYRVEIEDLNGEIDVRIPTTFNHRVEVYIGTASGAEVRLTSAGVYRVTALDARVHATNLRGEAVMITPDGMTAVSIPMGEEGVVIVDNNTVARHPAFVDLVANSDLLTSMPAAGSGGVLADPPFMWSCSSGPSTNLPSGRYRADVAPDGRPGFRLVRSDGADTNGYTRCEQALGEAREGVDVTHFDYLSLQTTLYIDYQSLSLCGIDGSECPLMLRVRFIDVNGNPGEWIHGIYARLDPGTVAPRRCATCLDNHLQIYEKTWYVYNSENLFTLFQESQRPAIITEVVFYASGHQYDVYVDEVALLAGNLQTLAGVVNGMDAEAG